MRAFLIQQVCEYELAGSFTLKYPHGLIPVNCKAFFKFVSIMEPSLHFHIPLNKPCFYKSEFFQNPLRCKVQNIAGRVGNTNGR
jgi:hypothetical protein